MTKTRNEQTEQRLLPHDTDTERAVLSSLIMYNDKFAKFGDLLNPDLFYYEKEKAIFRCIDGVIREGGVTDINSLYAYNESHTVGYNLFKSDFAEVVQNINRVTLEQDIQRLREFSRRRRCYGESYSCADGRKDS